MTERVISLRRPARLAPNPLPQQYDVIEPDLVDRHHLYPRPRGRLYLAVERDLIPRQAGGSMQPYSDRNEARQDVFACIDLFNNPKRRHGSANRRGMIQQSQGDSEQTIVAVPSAAPTQKAPAGA